MIETEVVRVSNWIEVRVTDEEAFSGKWTAGIHTDMGEALESAKKLRAGIF